MEIFLSALGVGCLAWTTAELLTLVRPRSRSGRMQFGAVDLETDREIDVVFDRRTSRRGRRADDPFGTSVWA